MQSKKARMLSYIDNFTINDFILTTKTCTGNVIVEKNSNIALSNRIYVDSKIRKLDGSNVYQMIIPGSCLEYRFKCDDNIFINLSRFNSSSVVEVTEECFKEYLSMIKNLTNVETEAFALMAELDIENLSSLKTEDKKTFDKLLKRLINTRFFIERYNVLNLVTDKKPFSEDEYSSFIDKIKEHMKSHL